MAHFILRASVGLGLAILIAASVTAAENSADLVQDALHQQIYGRQATELLARAAKADPDYAPAYWHRGYVKNGDDWVLAAAFQPSDALKSYFARRDQLVDSLEGNLSAANWCRQQGLKAQERMHLLQVLSFDPDHVDARNRLGFQLSEAGWISTNERQAAEAQATIDRQNLDAWRVPMQEILTGLTHRSGKRQYLAKSRLQDIHDTKAIVAMEAVLSNASEGIGQLAIDVVGKMEGQEAVDSLVRHSLYSPWQSVRDAAARRLKKRDPLTYAPQLLGAMKSPVTRHAYMQRDGKNVQYCRVLMRENQNERQRIAVNHQGGELLAEIFFRPTQRARKGPGRRESAHRDFERPSRTKPRHRHRPRTASRSERLVGLVERDQRTLRTGREAAARSEPHFAVGSIGTSAGMGTPASGGTRSTMGPASGAATRILQRARLRLPGRGYARVDDPRPATDRQDPAG